VSSLTKQLTSTLYEDLSAVLDDYQFFVATTGGLPWPDITLPQMQAFALARSFFKKYNEEDEPPLGCQKVALGKFLAVNQSCGNWELMIESEKDALLIGEFQHKLDRFWYLDPDGGSVMDSLSAAMHLGGVGPGSSVKARDADFYTKVFDSPHSSTSSDLLWFWEKTMDLHPLWHNANITRRSRHADPIVRGNSLSFVNKNVDTARCISTEPFVNMWFQKGLGEALESRLIDRCGIDLSVQPEINVKLAEIGSATGRYATLDLRSASDSISTLMLRRLAPKGLVRWCELFRSPETRLPKWASSNGKLTLNMIATMGNGFCFPLQTTLFATVVAAVYSLRGIKMTAEANTFDPRKKNYGVFGDDIIVVTEAVPDVVRLLNLLGFEVNSDKSHVEGPFRESCGGDFFNGHPCRGVFVKTLNTAQDVYVAINTLNRWSAMTGIRLRATVGLLRQQVSCAAPLVPPDEDDTAGIHVPSSMADGIKRGPYGIWKYRKDSPVPVKVKIFYQDKFNVRIVPDVSDERSSTIDRKVNLAGLLISSLGGYVRGGTRKEPESFTLRTRRTRYRTTTTITPHWDYFPDVRFPFWEGCGSRPLRDASYGFAAWKAAVMTNL